MSLTQHSTLNFTCWMSFKLVDLKVVDTCVRYITRYITRLYENLRKALPPNFTEL